MKSNYFRAFILGIFCVLLACGSRATFAAPTDACSLLTPAQVSAVLGANVGPGHSITPKLCEWTVPGQSGLQATKLVVDIITPQGFAAAKMPVGRGSTKTPVSGVGDEAISGTTPKFATVLTVKKGDFYFVVHISPYSDGDDIKAKEKTLALQILAKL